MTVLHSFCILQEIADQTDLIIHIDRAFPQTFKEYHFVVGNDLGSVRSKILLSRGQSTLI